MNKIFKNVKVVNEGEVKEVDVLTKGGRIEKIDNNIDTKECEIIDGEGGYLLPGVIDDQVHFREPGLTHKATIGSESAAAARGGVTTFFDQPNTVPQAVTIEKLEEKYEIAKRTSFVNYSFLLGGTNTNLEELKKVDTKNVAGVKLFLGSSTGNMLVDDAGVIEDIFRNVNSLIAVHCEDEATIRKNIEIYKNRFGEVIAPKYHSEIRSGEACYISSKKAVELAEKTGARLHVFHVSTGRELELFRNDILLKDKKITAEVCIHHLWFCEEDYAKKGYLIKWNPAIKTKEDREGLWQGLLDGRLDVIATDHAPHTMEEKSAREYSKIPSGGPMVEHSLVAMLQKMEQGKIGIETIVEKMSHNPAILFGIKERGYIREGYCADIVLVGKEKWQVGKENIHYKCGWSPMEGEVFDWKVKRTYVNGFEVFDGESVRFGGGERVKFVGR